MEALVSLAALILLTIFITSVIALIRPLPRLWLPTRKRAGIVVAASFVLMGVFGNLLPKPPVQEETAKAEEQEPEPVEAGEKQETVKVELPELTEEDKCRYNSQCWGTMHRRAAHVMCSDPIEELAKYDFEWTTGWGENIFSTWISVEGYKFIRGGKGVVYIGDKIKFQNGFGTFRVHTYECHYDPDSDTVLQVTAKPGRVSQHY